MLCNRINYKSTTNRKSTTNPQHLEKCDTMIHNKWKQCSLDFDLLWTCCSVNHKTDHSNQPINRTYYVRCLHIHLQQIHKNPKNKKKLECGPMPSVMAALPNIGGALCESSVIPFLVPRREVWLTPAVGVPCRKSCQYRRTQDLNAK